MHIKGLILINNIFNISLLYLDSLVEIYNICEKGYIYFIEFINQINITSSFENNSFELTLKDATIFSYKKTIFTFNNNIKTNLSLNDKFKLKIINECNYIINNLSTIFSINIYNIYENLDKYDNYLDEKINSSILNLTKFIKKIFIVTDLNSKQYENNSNYINYFININSFLNFINENYKLDNFNEEFFNNVIVFIEKYITKKIFLKKINNIYNLNNNSFNLLEKYENIQPLINSLFKIT